MSKANEVTLPVAVTAQAEIMQPKVVDGQFTDQNAYADFLSAHDMPIETAEKLSELNTTWIAACGLVATNTAIPMMTADANLQSVNMTFPMSGKDTVNTSFQRERSGTIGEDKVPYTTYGLLSTKVSVHATGNRGALAAVKNFARQNATEAFGSN